MCGRFTLTLDPGELQQELDLSQELGTWQPRFNIAPTQPVAVVNDASQRRMVQFRWGLIPAWAKDPEIGNRMINARSETLQEKPAFKRLFAQRRCLILADGFYEWAPGKTGGKTPFYFYMPGRQAFTFAGLWDSWKSPEGNDVFSCTIITCAANETIAPFHERMPVILPAEGRWVWLDPAAKASDLQRWLAPLPASLIAMHQVSTLVNNPANESPNCILPTELP